MAREAKKTIINPTREQAEDAMHSLAKSNSNLKRLEAKIELEKQRIDEKYSDEVLKLQQEKAQHVEVLEVWGKKDCPNWEGKSFDLMAGTIGFRTSTPKVDKDKKFTWPAVTELLKEYFPELVRTKDEPNKEAIIALREDDSFAQISKKCHISVVQDETFFVTPKEEELATA